MRCTSSPWLLLSMLVLLPCCGVDVTPYWTATARDHRGNNGQTFEQTCPTNGTFGSVWGTDVYTDDSSICTAAVHASAITQDLAWIVTYEIQSGQSSYIGSTRNGVTTKDYGSWDGSFVVRSAVERVVGGGD